MTRDEAISIIKTAIAEVEWEYPMNYAAALDMAIEALSGKDTKQKIIDALHEEIIPEEEILFGDEYTYGYNSGLTEAISIVVHMGG